MRINIKIRQSKGQWGRPPASAWILGLAALFLLLSLWPKEKASWRSDESGAAEIPVVQAPVLNVEILSIKEGSTLSDILDDYGFTPADIHKLRAEVQSVYDLARIKAGQDLRIYRDEADSIVRMEYEIDDESYLEIHFEKGSYRAEIKKIPFEMRTAVIWGRIDENPIEAVRKTGEDAVLALLLAEIFAWDIDFYTGLRKGDVFKILFEKKYSQGEPVGYGKILAAEFVNNGKLFRAYRFVYPDTEEAGYFRPDGGSMKRQFRISPFKFGYRITSRFSYRRLHPIRKVYRAHLGVDYGAPVGTPVHATSAGTVTYVGRNGAAGRQVTLSHKNRYETMYLHLSRYAVRKGEKVNEGQVIGYVGNSGESSGPHLDYRIKENGRYINPLSYKFKPVEPLRAEFRTDFEELAVLYLWTLDVPLYLASNLTGATAWTSRGIADGAGDSDGI